MKDERKTKKQLVAELEELRQRVAELEASEAERVRAEEERQTHLWFLESLEQVNRAIQGTNDLEQMMSDVLDVVLSVLDCDRASLVYPCDPEAATWQAPMERTKPEWPGALTLGLEVPMDPEVARVFKVSRITDGPVVFGPGCKEPLPTEIAVQFNIQSQITMALYPKIDKPWNFVIHQCSHPRIWTQEERRFFEEVGRRLADGLTSLLTYRNLKESERRYRMVFENSPVSIWEEDFSGVKRLFDDLKMEGVTDIETYLAEHPETVRQCADLTRIVDVNRAALALHAAANKEDLLAGLVNTFAPESFDTFRHELVCLWNGEAGMVRDAVVKTLAGEPRNVTVYVSVCPGYEETLSKVLVSLTDITEHKQMEQALVIREQEYRTLLESFPDFIVRYDRDLRRTYVNPAWEKASGLSREEVINVPAADIPKVPQPTNEEYVEKLRQVLATGTPQAIEFTWVNAYGVLLFLDYVIVPEYDRSGKIVGVLSVGRDITERVRAEEALRESEERSRAMLESSLDNLYRRDLRNNTYDYVSPAVERLTGYSVEEMLSMPLESLISKMHPDDIDSVKRVIGESLASDRAAYLLEYRFRHKEGQYRWFSDLFAVIRDAQGRPLYLVGSARDVTERKEAEEVLQRHAERLEALHQIDQATLAARSSEEIAQTALRYVRRLIPCVGAAIMQLDLSAGEVYALVTDLHQDFEDLKRVRFPVKEAEDWIEGFRQGEVSMAEDILKQSPQAPATRMLTDRGFRSYIAIPLIAQGEFIGVLAAGADVPHAFTSEHIKIGREVAASLAVAIRNAQLSEAERIQRERETVLLNLARVAGSTLDLDEVMHSILDHLRQLIQFDSASIKLLEGNALHTAAAVGFDDQAPAYEFVLDLDEFPLNRWVIENRSPICVDDVQLEERYIAISGAEHVRSFIGVPLLTKSGPVGMITLDHHTPGKFTENDVGLVLAIANQAAIAIENARLFQQVRANREQLRELTGYLQTAREEERANIAREIHDEFGQALTAMKMDLSWLKKQLPLENTVSAQKIDGLSSLVDDTIRMVRRIATELRPGILDHLGLGAALEWQVGEFSERTGIPCELKMDDEDIALDEDMALALFRIFQETLTNVARHAEATAVQVELKERPGQLLLTVQDDGKGFSREQLSDFKALGLMGMQERARAWDGHVTWQSTPGQGTTVTVQMPLAQEEGV